MQTSKWQDTLHRLQYVSLSIGHSKWKLDKIYRSSFLQGLQKYILVFAMFVLKYRGTYFNGIETFILLKLLPNREFV